MEKITNPKEYHPSIKFLSVFLIGILICFFLPDIISGTSDIVINIVELEGSGGIGATFSARNDKIVEIILMGPVVAVLYYMLMRYLIGKIDKTQGKNKYFLYAIEIELALLISLNVASHFVHLMFDQVSAAYRTLHGGYSLNEPLLYIYWADEWFGHTIIHVTYFSWFVLALVTEFLITETRPVNLDEFCFLIPLGVGIGVLDGYAAIRSEAGFILMILHIVLLGTQVVLIASKKINPLKYPVFMALLISSLFVIGYNIYWIFEEGIRAYYPFWSSNLS
jgi:hypothetical protein